MNYFLKFWLIGFLVLLVGCGEYETIEREIGYKGKARTNPWLAAERFVASYDQAVDSTRLWKDLDYDQTTWLIPMATLSNDTYIRQAKTWVEEGGHLILIAENTGSSSDWNLFPHSEKLVEIDPSLNQWLRSAGMDFSLHQAATASKVDFGKRSYEVDAKSSCSVTVRKSEARVFASRKFGQGRLTVLTDGKIFRNRWISEREHASLFKALVDASDWDGAVGFMRGTELSFWHLLKDYLWAVLIALGVFVVLWLWKSMPRFGPRLPEKTEEKQRGYDHHLEALGFYQWRMNKASGLLAPLRAQVVERGQRYGAKIGKRDDDFFQILAELADIPREQVQRALAEQEPADAAILTRTTADLQRLLKLLN